MKKLLSIFAAVLTVNTFACWFTQENFNGNYIAGVNNYQARYSETANLSQAIYTNDLSVAFPLTVWVKVTPLKYSPSGELLNTPAPLVKAVLQYKVLPSGAWKTVKTIENVSWKINWQHPVALFGKNTIDPDVPAGTAILIRFYLSDGTFETGDLSTDISGDEVPAKATQDSGGSYSGGWTAPFVLKVIYNGRRRPQ
ncbi:MAG: hypothetical protein IKB99_06160 [Lentisphaeria bacterium]|nr:hypothetical protein [Lentisphaeria bacterium]